MSESGSKIQDFLVVVSWITLLIKPWSSTCSRFDGAANYTERHYPDNSAVFLFDWLLGYTHIQTYIGHSQTLARAVCTLDVVQVKSLSRCRGLYNCWPGTSPDLEVLCLQSALRPCQRAPVRT